MGAITFFDTQQSLPGGSGGGGGGGGRVVEEIPGLIRVHKDGRVDRVQVVPDVPCTWALVPDVACGDVVIDRSTAVWARFYVPRLRPGRLPLLVYFHGGGFCVGSASWACYHGFLSRVASQACCVVMSVNYRLAPEHRLPAAYDDGVAAVKWATQQGGAAGSTDESAWWRGRCDLSRVFLGGDSAGATIAHHAAARLGGHGVRGVILIQPFFGGEERTASERTLSQSPGSILSLPASDTYWRLALPAGAKRDHPWCDPLRGAGVEEARLPPVLMFVAEADILRDRDVEVWRAMRRAGRRAECAVQTGVGHAFQVLSSAAAAQERTQEMVARIRAFMIK